MSTSTKLVGRKAVLVISGDAGFVVPAEIVSRAGCQVHSVSRISEAMGVFQSAEGKIALILLDGGNRPGVFRALIQWFRSEGFAGPIVVVSSGVVDDDPELLRCGATEVCRPRNWQPVVRSLLPL